MTQPGMPTASSATTGIRTRETIADEELCSLGHRDAHLHPRPPTSSKNCVSSIATCGAKSFHPVRRRLFTSYNVFRPVFRDYGPVLVIPRLKAAIMPQLPQLTLKWSRFVARIA